MNKKSFLWSLFVVTLMAMSSCSSKTDNLLKLVPADAEFVMVGNAQKVIESAGGSLSDSQLKLPEWIDELDPDASDDIEDFNKKLKMSGISTESFLLTASFSDNYYVCIVSIANKDKFVKFIKNEMDFDDEIKDDDVTYYSSNTDKKMCVAVSGSYAYISIASLYGDLTPKRVISKLIEDAKASSFANTSMAKYISSGNAFGISTKISDIFNLMPGGAYMSVNMTGAFDGYYCCTCSLTDNDLDIAVKTFDAEGNDLDMKDFEKMMDLKAKISPNALKYLGQNESLVAAACMKNIQFDNCFDFYANAANLSRTERQQMGVVTDYLKNIDGTVAFGVGLTNGIQSIAYLENDHDMIAQIDFTIVIETKGDKAKKLMADLTELMNTARIPYEGSDSDGYTVNFNGIRFYFAVEDNYIIASNHNIKKSNDNPTVKTFDFSDYIAAAALLLNRDNQLIKDLKLENEILSSYAFDAKTKEVKINLNIKGGKGKGILEKLAYMLIHISEQDYSSFYPSTSDSDYDSSESDYYDDAYYDEFIPDDMVF